MWIQNAEIYLAVSRKNFQRAPAGKCVSKAKSGPKSVTAEIIEERIVVFFQTSARHGFPMSASELEYISVKAAKHVGCGFCKRFLKLHPTLSGGRTRLQQAEDGRAANKYDYA